MYLYIMYRLIYLSHICKHANIGMYYISIYFFYYIYFYAYT